MINVLKNFLNNYNQSEKDNFGSLKNEFLKLKLVENSVDPKVVASTTSKTATTSKDSDKVRTQIVAKSECNAKKNRYRDILPFDYNRVILKPFVGGDHLVEGAIKEVVPSIENDYINASYINGALYEREYVVTQGPLNSTIPDFWYMVWQEEIKLILMICNLVEGGHSKCERYWPPEGERMVLNAPSACPEEVLAIKLTSYTVEGDHGIVHRVLRLFHGPDNREIHHFQYLNWPDHGKPVDHGLSLVKLLNLMNLAVPYDERYLADVKLKDDSPKPHMLVHCSAGVGRTGSFVAIHVIMNRLAHERLEVGFSVFDLVRQLRDQRTFMVQSLDQYVFVHETTAILFAAKAVSLTNDSENFCPDDPFANVTKISELETMAAERLKQTAIHVPTLLRRQLLSLQNAYATLVDLEIRVLYRACQLEASIIENTDLSGVRDRLKAIPFGQAASLIDCVKGSLITLLALFENRTSGTSVLYRFGSGFWPDEQDGSCWVPLPKETSKAEDPSTSSGIYSVAATPTIPSTVMMVNKIKNDINTLYELFRRPERDET